MSKSVKWNYDKTPGEEKVTLDVDTIVSDAIMKARVIEEAILTGVIVDMLRSRGYVIFEPGSIPTD